MQDSRPKLCIVTPASASANNGNWHTASRWRRFMLPLAKAEIVQAWTGQPADALVALHAARSADSILRFREAHPARPVAVVLTGTDIYRDIAPDSAAQRALECASQLVVLQAEALARVPAGLHGKTRVILQSAPRLVWHQKAGKSFGMVAVGHLRAEKDPLTLMAAVKMLPPDSPIRVVHIGNPLDDALGAAARETMESCPPNRYRWLGGLPQADARRWIARSRALVHASRIEGGANAVIEAIRSQVPVLASEIDGNVGLLGRDYGGYFPPGDAPALAALMARFAGDDEFAGRLRAQCAALEARYAPAVEMARVRELVSQLLAATPPLAQSHNSRHPTQGHPSP